jgi:hypothetical protein
MAKITIDIQKERTKPFVIGRRRYDSLVFVFDDINSDMKIQFFAENFDKISLEDLEKITNK